MTASELAGRVPKCRRVGRGRWIAHCPAHADRAPSLSIREGGERRILLHCFAGCGAQAILEALGLTLADLFPEQLPRRRARALPRTVSLGDVIRSLEFELSVVWIVLSDFAANRPVDFERAQIARERVLAFIQAIYYATR